MPGVGVPARTNGLRDMSRIYSGAGWWGWVRIVRAACDSIIGFSSSTHSSGPKHGYGLKVDGRFIGKLITQHARPAAGYG
jgi:hypothetical protein